MKGNQKKLLLLGGLRYLVPVIEAAHKMGHYVITADYLPGNIAHRYSDEFQNVSVIDKEAVLRVAERRQVDGIMSFAVDPGVETASYVAEKLGLSFQGSHESVRILQNKDLFRRFLADNSFNVPRSWSFGSVEEAMSEAGAFCWPVIVKPVDSAGSKGVSKAEDMAGLKAALEYAAEETHCGRIIVEEYLEKKGFSSDSECFTIDGKLVFCSFSDQRFDPKAENPYAPSAYSWPPSMPEETQAELRSEIERLAGLLGLRTGIYNVETRLCTDGKAYIMEVSPRGGGNRLAEMLRLACGADLITNAVKDALGENTEEMTDPVYDGFLAEVVLHADIDGRFSHLDLADEMKQYVVETDLWVSRGDKVCGFKGANNAIGTLVLRFDRRELLEEAMADISSWCRIVTE